MDDVHGLVVYDEESPPTWPVVNFTGSISSPEAVALVEYFIEATRRADLQDQWSFRARLARIHWMIAKAVNPQPRRLVRRPGAV